MLIFFCNLSVDDGARLRNLPIDTRNTMKPQLLDWTNYLYEIGGPVRSAVQRIQLAQQQADQELAEAKRRHREVMAELKSEADKLERYIETLWTADEIASAKRGCFLIEGKEIKP